MNLSLWACVLCVVSALRFQLEARTDGKGTRCIRDFVGQENLVVVKVRTNGQRGDGQMLSMSINDSRGNKYGYKDDIIDRIYQTFVPSADTSFDVCFTNTLTQAAGPGAKFRDIELEVEIGAAARDWNAVQASERLKPAELDLRRLNDIADEIKNELEYMRLREEKLRDTNESTNGRIKNFFILTLLSFLGLGAWQLQYLRAYFRSKHII